MNNGTDVHSYFYINYANTQIFENLGKYSAVLLPSKICLCYMSPFASTTLLNKLSVHPLCCWLIDFQENE